MNPNEKFYKSKVSLIPVIIKDHHGYKKKPLPDKVIRRGLILFWGLFFIYPILKPEWN